MQDQLDERQLDKRDVTLTDAAADVVNSQPPVRQSVKLRRALKGHFGKVTSLQWVGKQHVVSAGQDGNLIVWNPLTSNKTHVIPLKSAYVMAVGMMKSADKLLIACGGLDNLCTLYSVNAQPDSSGATTKNIQSSAKEMASHDGFVSCCRFFSENSIITSSGDSTCIQWDVSTGQPVTRFSEHTADALYLSVQPNSQSIFASCSVDHTVKIWDTRSSKPNQAVQTHFAGAASGDINAVEFLPTDGNAFCACGQDAAVRLWDMRAAAQLAEYGMPIDVVPNEDDDILGAADANGIVASAAPPAQTMEMAQQEGFKSLAVSSSGRIIFCGHADGTVVAYDVLSQNTEVPCFVLSGAHDRHVSGLDVSPSGDGLVTGSWDSTLKVWA